MGDAPRKFAVFSEHVRGEPRVYWLQENKGSDSEPNYVQVEDEDYPGRYNHVTNKQRLIRWVEKIGGRVDG